jgi:flagellar basal-body rod protein FlgG
MFKGFYNLTSGMLSQGRRLDVVSNNMTNVATSGYKSERYTDSTFQEYMVSRVGNKDKSNPAEIGGASYLLAPSELYTNYTQGGLEETGYSLDFAIEGDGFFAIQGADGIAYSRSGSFSLDEEGYLCLPGEGRVLDTSGNPILLGSDQIRVDQSGSIYSKGGQFIARLGVYAFADNSQLEKNPRGLFTGNGPALADATVHWKMIERSNVDLVQQMVEMISSLRALQSAAQMSKMYDQLMTKASSDLGRV